MSEHSATLPCSLVDVERRTRQEGDCWNWIGTLANKRYPKIKIAGVQYYVRHLVWQLQHNKPLPKGKVISTSCRNDRCCNPAHVVAKSKTELLKRAVREGAFKDLRFRAAVAAGKRRNSKLSDAGVLELRSTEEPVATVAKRLGISETYAHYVRSHKSRIDFTNPYAALQAGST